MLLYYRLFDSKKHIQQNKIANKVSYAKYQFDDKLEKALSLRYLKSTLLSDCQSEIGLLYREKGIMCMKILKSSFSGIGVFMALIILTLTIFLGGCGQKQATEKSDKITITDLAGREVKLKAPVNKTILQYSGSGGAFITMLALEGKDVPKKIAGWDMGLKENRYDMYEKFCKSIPELKKIPDVGKIEKDTFNVEKVISLKPDVVILTIDLLSKSTDIVKKLEEAGIPAVFIDYHKENVENHTKSVLLLGKILGKEKRANEIADFCKEQVTKVTSRLEKIQKPKPSVYIEVGSDGPATYGNTYGNYMWGAVVERCGGTNIAKDKIKTYGAINPEFLLKANPDIIVITGAYWPKKPGSLRLGYTATVDESKKQLTSFTKRPGWETLKAVKNNKIYSVSHVNHREVYDFVAMQYLAKVFYPEEFKDLNPEESYKEFHKRFLPVDYNGIWTVNLCD